MELFMESTHAGESDAKIRVFLVKSHRVCILPKTYVLLLFSTPEAVLSPASREEGTSFARFESFQLLRQSPMA